MDADPRPLRRRLTVPYVAREVLQLARRAVRGRRRASTAGACEAAREMELFAWSWEDCALALYASEDLSPADCFDAVRAYVRAARLPEGGDHGD